MAKEPRLRRKAYNANGVWRAVIVDIDGVLADSLQLLRETYDGTYDVFHSRLRECGTLNNGVRELVEIVWEAGLAVLLASARPDSTQVETVSWLLQHGIEYDAIRLRPQGMKPLEFKAALLDNALKSRRLAPELAIDDDPAMVDMYRSKGIPCIYVHSGCYDEQHQWRRDEPTEVRSNEVGGLGGTGRAAARTTRRRSEPVRRIDRRR